MKEYNREYIKSALKGLIEYSYRTRYILETLRLDLLHLEENLSVVLVWEEGFDTKDGYELCVSVRKKDSSYFMEDWDIIGEDFSVSREVVQSDEDMDKIVSDIEEILDCFQQRLTETC